MSRRRVFDALARPLHPDRDDRYRYLIGLGRTLDPVPETARKDADRVPGCVSQVWFVTDIVRNGTREPTLRFTADSDAHIVRGLIAILLAACSGQPPGRMLRSTHSRCSSDSDLART